MKTEGIYEFKCRRCGEIMPGKRGNEMEMLCNMRDAFFDTELKPTFKSIHECHDNGFGVADFIGCRIEIK